MRASQLKKPSVTKISYKEKAQSGKKVVAKKTKVSHDSDKNKNPMENYAKDFNMLTIKPLKGEKPPGDYKITGSNSGTTGRVRKNGGKIIPKKK